MAHMFFASIFNNGGKPLKNVDDEGINTGFGSSFGQNCTLRAMFQQNSVFNENISKWNTDNVTDMSLMFADAFFNRKSDLTQWNNNLSNVQDWTEIFYLGNLNFELTVDTQLNESGDEYPQFILIPPIYSYPI